MQEFRRGGILRRRSGPVRQYGRGGRQAKGPDLRLPSPPELRRLRHYIFERRSVGGSGMPLPTSTTGAVALYVEVVTLYFSPIGWSVSLPYFWA